MQDLHGVHSAAFDIAAITGEIRAEAGYGRDGHSARTLLREADLRIVLLVMKAGSTMKEHRVSETASIYALTGHVRLRLPDRVAALSGGSLLVLEPGLQHDVEALEESSLLLTLGSRGKT
ncbi:MAG: AraC family ligand binding domain-containing protein [Pseudomonadota bacterium]